MQSLKHSRNLSFLDSATYLHYCLFKKKMDSSIFAITREQKELESCGFHQWKEEKKLLRIVCNLFF